MAQPFDEQRFDVMGDAFPVAEHVGFVRALGLFSVSTNGVLAHRSGGDSGNLRLIWFDRQGNPRGVLGAAGLYRSVALSPDGNKVAVARDDPQSADSDIWILDVQRGVPNRFTFDPARESDPVWSSGGSIIMFSSAGRTPIPGILQKDYGKGGKEELMIRMETPIRANDWSPDGRRFLYSAEPNALYLGSIDGGPSLRVPLATNLAARYAFGFAAFDNAQVRHATTDDALFMVFGR